jgi:hypothetical protein
MSIQTNIVAVMLLLGSAVTASGQSASSLPQITKGDVIEGMARKRLAVHPWQVSMLSTIPVHAEHPVLEAMKIEPLTGDTSRVLMRCADRSVCIPFYVAVSGLAPGDRLPEQLSGGRVSVFSKLAGGPIIVKRGSKATLEIVAPEMVITVPVVCLQSGRLGEQIKVSAVDQKNTYLGEIIRPGLLRGRL